MKKGKYTIIGFIIIVLVIAASAVGIVLYFMNGQITISFDTDGAGTIEAVQINKGESVVLPKVEKKGYVFDGWFLDDERVSDSTTFEKSATLKANWISSKTKTFTVSFDSKGGSTVKSIKVACGKTLKLPAEPTRVGYAFDGWEDKNGTPILNDALLTCNNIKLYAKWVELKGTQATTYTCPSGYEYNGGTSCVSKVNATETCPTGYKYSSKKGFCYSEQIVPYQLVCKREKMNGNLVSGTLLHSRGVLYYCGYGEISMYEGNERSCEHSGATYSTIDNKCYSRYIENNYTSVCPDGTFEAKEGVLDDSQTTKMCVYIKDRVKTCPSGYIEEDGICYKFVNATAN